MRTYHQRSAAIALIVMAAMIHSFAWAQPAGKAALLTDASGSMLGFFRTGEIYKLHDQIVEATGRALLEKRDYYFECYQKNLRDTLVAYAKPYYAPGQITLIDRAFQNVMRKHSDLNMLWLVTDNVQDPTTSDVTQASIEKFYGIIQDGGRITMGYFFPPRLEFNGPLYNRQGNRRILDPYQGPRALIIYALLLDPKFEAEFKNIVARFKSQAGLEMFPCKINSDAMNFEPKVVTVPDQAEHKLIFSNDTLVIGDRNPFDENERMLIKFKVTFASNLENITIAESTKIKFEYDDATSSDFLPPQKPDITWNPSKLQYKLNPPKYRAGGLQAKADTVEVTIEFKDGVQFNKTPEALLRYIFKSEAGDFKGKIEASLLVERNQLSIVQPVLEEYGTLAPEYFTDPTLAGQRQLQTKIYDLNGMFTGLQKRQPQKISKIYPMVLKVSYPPWPLFAVLAFFGAIVAAIVAWWRLQPQYTLSPMGNDAFQFQRIRKAAPSLEAKYETYVEPAGMETVAFDADEEKHKFKLFPFFGKQPIRVGDHEAAVLSRKPLVGVSARACKGFLVQNKKRLSLSDAGTTFEITTDLKDTPSAESETGRGSGTNDLGDLYGDKANSSGSGLGGSKAGKKSDSRSTMPPDYPDSGNY